MTNLTDDYTNAYDLRTGIRNEEVQEGRCPCCGSRNVDYDSTDYLSEKVFMLYRCSECGSEFEFHYGLDGVYVINDNHNKED